MVNSKIKMVEEKLFSTKTPTEKINDEIRNSLYRIRTEKLMKFSPSKFSENNWQISEEDCKKINELADFLTEYVQSVGKEQAILDFQTGLNLLNNYKKDSIIKEKIMLKEDADFGEKTLGAFFNVLKNYPVNVIKHFIKQGAINNQIWKTKNNKEINTDSIVLDITQKLDERKN